MLAHAAAMLDAGDRLQASEKIWGAVSHALRAVASNRGWPISVNADARDVARYIAQQTGDGELTSLGGVELYHYNFYKDAMDVEDIRDGLATAERICGKLLAADASLPMSLPPPRGPKFRAYERRNGLVPDPVQGGGMGGVRKDARPPRRASARPRRRIGSSAVGGEATLTRRFAAALSQRREGGGGACAPTGFPRRRE